MKLGESTGLGIKKARQIKHAVGVYLEEEAKLRAELDAERGRRGAEGAPASVTAAPIRTCIGLRARRSRASELVRLGSRG